MKQDEEEQLPDYKKGFNDGYLIETHNPKLAEKIRFEQKDQPDYLIGFLDGKSQRQKELDMVQEHEKREHRLKELKQAREKSKGRSQGRGR